MLATRHNLRNQITEEFQNSVKALSFADEQKNYTYDDAQNSEATNAH